MTRASFKSRPDLDAMVAAIDRQLDTLYATSSAASRAEIWSNLASATLKLAAPEDHEYVYERLHAVFKAHRPATADPATP